MLQLPDSIPRRRRWVQMQDLRRTAGGEIRPSRKEGSGVEWPTNGGLEISRASTDRERRIYRKSCRGRHRPPPLQTTRTKTRLQETLCQERGRKSDRLLQRSGN